MKRIKQFNAASADFSAMMTQAITKVQQERVLIIYPLPKPFIPILKSESSMAYGMKGKSKFVSIAVREFLLPDNWPMTNEGAKPWLRVISDTMVALRFNKNMDKIDLEADLKIPSWKAAMDASLLAASDEENPVYLDASVANVVSASVIWKLSKLGRI